MDNALLLPLLIQIWLTFIIALMTLKTRIKSAKRGEVKLAYFKHNQGNAPEKMLRLDDNLKNQFELPILFYTIILLLLLLQQNSLMYLIMAWIFVISRIIHAYIHIKTNHIRHRMMSFLAGFITLMLMWLSLSVELLM